LLVVVFAVSSRAEDAFHFLDVNGKGVEVSADPGLGRALLLHFWATWCPDCTEDLALLAEVSAGCDRVRAIAVNAGDGADEVQSYLSRHPTGLAVLRDPSGSAWRKLDGQGLPMNAYFTDRGREMDVGPKTRAQWKEFFAQLGCP